ncbi:MAG: 50S ribosomal protein L3 [Patescibacteria group bacterium]|nr:MAG: 50S ribosomal protein L3 [Patescibacteria group bacterium]
MSGFILGSKQKQSQTFNDKGERIPVTFIDVDSCYLVDIKTFEKDGYFSVKLGFGQIKNIKKPIKGQLEKAGIKTPLRFLKEIRLDKYKDIYKVIEENNKLGISVGEAKFFIGDQIKPELLFKKGDILQVSGISKGKGFAGVVKRHHFKGGPRTHGKSHNEKAPGSIGMTTTPGRVFKGKRMAGRMGGERVTVKGLELIDIKDNQLVIKGLIPGAKNGLVEIVS